MKSKDILWKYLKLLNKRLPLYLTAIFAMTAFYSLFELAGSLLMREIFNITQKGSFGNILPKIIVNIVLGLLTICVASVFMLIYNNEAKRGGLEIKKRVFAKSMKLPISYYDTHHSGELLSRLVYDTDKASDIYTSRLRRVLTPVISVSVYFIAMLLLNTGLTVVLAGINILFFLINSMFTEPMKNVGKEMSRKNSIMTQKLSNMIHGIEIFKMFDTNKKTVEQYQTANDEFVKVQKKKMKLGGALEALNVGFDLLFALLFIVIGIIFIQNDFAQIGDVAAIYTMYGALSFQFLQLGKYYPELMNCIAYAERVFEFLDEQEENWLCGEGYEQITSEDINSCDYAIEIQDISFRYESNEHSDYVFEHENLKILNHVNTAITGKSGCGKSTIAKLILGFYPFETGDIKLFGKSYHVLNLNQIRDLIAFVPQESYLFEVSILENIRYGRIDATDEEVVQAAELANADGFIKRQENGYDTIVHKRGMSLSGGERQRIAIARAILKNAPVILFDEATSAIDNESEQFIQDAIAGLKKKKTVITIAHRKSTIDRADAELKMF